MKRRDFTLTDKEHVVLFVLVVCIVVLLAVLAFVHIAKQREHQAAQATCELAGAELVGSYCTSKVVQVAKQ